LAITSKIEYIGGLRTEAIHVKSDTKIVTDAPTDNEGKGESFSPTDLVATALGSCMLTIMGIKARDKNIDMDGTKVQTLKTMASNPRRIERIDIKMTMPKKYYSDSDKKVIEMAAKSCPVGHSLHADLIVVVDIIWS